MFIKVSDSFDVPYNDLPRELKSIIRIKENLDPDTITIPYAKLHLFFDDIWYGTMWHVVYEFLGIYLIARNVIGGAAIHTSRENDYPKIPTDIAYQWVKKYTDISHAVEIDYVLELEKYGYDKSVLTKNPLPFVIMNTPVKRGDNNGNMGT